MQREIREKCTALPTGAVGAAQVRQAARIALRTEATERPAPPRTAYPGRTARGGYRNRAWIVRIFGLSLGVTLIIALGLQFLIHERAALSSHPELAALSDTLCRQLPCPDLPRTIPGTLEVGDLHLHTQAQGWLRVEMRITNTANRAQPWPPLELLLVDRFGQTLAQVRWTPLDYLDPDEAARSLEPGEARRLRLVIDRPADAVEGVSVHLL